MARTRRRMATPARKRQRRDWVYRGPVFDSAGSPIDDLWTYDSGSKLLVAGTANANAAVLYDSHNYTASTAAGQFDAPRVRVWSPGRAEGGKAFIHRVEGLVVLTPSTWALGSFFGYGIRFGIFEQDASVGAFLIDPNYTMMNGGSLFIAQEALWANDRKWQHERRHYQQFSDNSQRFMLRFAFSVRRSLAPNECYGVYTESVGGSVNLTEVMWLRTLVSDER